MEGPQNITPRREPLSARSGFTLIELVMVIVVIGILAAIALPSYVKIKERAKEAESKAALHNIQIDLERFATDHEGDYPPYLIGGSNATLVLKIGADDQLSQSLAEIDRTRCSDPMLRAGYLDSYPRNPFIRNTLPVQQIQVGAGDPLRSALYDGKQMGTRFGAFGKLMGQCLCESRYLMWNYKDPVTNEIKRQPTWSNIQYEFFDVWSGSQRQRAFLPGSFMYKSIGEIVAQPDESNNRDYVEVNGKTAIIPHSNRNTATQPVAISNYMLGVWGGYRTRGMDVLGEEPLVIFSFPGSSAVKQASSDFIYDPRTGRYELPPQRIVNHYQLLGIPSWTRGVNRSHVGPLWGSPYGPSHDDASQLTFGNPNGFSDAIIMVLNAGQ